jgi:hypothetical protein
MATTTNYSWVTPDDTSLVKDGAAAIRTLGTSVDTTTKNLNPSTTLGDIEYRSSTANTNTRLGIGTTGQVLTVSGGVPSWATSASGGMTLLSTTTLSGTTTTVSSINQTHTDLQIVILNATAGATYKPRFLPNSTADLGCMVECGGTGGFTGSVATQIQASNIALFSASAVNAITLTIHNYASTSLRKTVIAYGSSANDNQCSFSTMGSLNTNSAITSFAYTTMAGTASFTGGTMLIYGVK